MEDFSAEVGDERIEDVGGPSSIGTVNKRESRRLNGAKSMILPSQILGIKTILGDSGPGTAQRCLHFQANQGTGRRRPIHGRRRGGRGRFGRGGQGGHGNRGRGGANKVDITLLIRGLSNSMGSFGWNVYRRLAISNPDNFVFSPFSVYAALGMVLLGAH
ncbi:serine protease inhibitor a3k, partial [Plakobranchus ocellatus]